MKRKLQLSGIIIGGLLVLIIGASFLLNPIIEKRIVTAIHNELPEHYSVNDFELQINSLKGNAYLHNLQIKINNDLDSSKNSTLSLEKARFSGLSNVKLLFSDHIAFKTVSLSGIEMDYFQIEKPEEHENKEASKPFEKAISIQNFQLENSSFSIRNEEGKLIAALNISELTMNNPKINAATLSNKIPFEYQDVSLTAGEISFQINPYDLMTIDQLTLQNKQLALTDFAIKTIYSKAEFSLGISKERDHFDLTVPQVVFEDFLIEENTSDLSVNAQKLTFNNPEFYVYRDKLVADDTSVKPLYSKSLRELPFKLTINTAMIENAQIEYEERVHAERAPGLVKFSNLNAEMQNLSNTYAAGEKETTIDIQSKFMNESPLKLKWRFDINDTQDTFQIQGEIGRLNASKMNAFTVSNLNIETEGELQKTYFNINGNNHQSRIDFRIKYENFKVDLLNNEQKINKFLSTVANVFVKKNTNSKEGKFKEVQAQVERKKDKSFFNYLWINIEAGLKEAMLKI